MFWFVKYLLLFGAVHSNVRTEHYVDLIELNHIRNNVSEFDQIILWNEYPAVGLNRSEFRTVGFFVLDRGVSLNIIRRNKSCRVIINNTNIVSPLFRESWSGVDPERESARKHWDGNPPNIFNQMR